jgi:hypothetical protein
MRNLHLLPIPGDIKLKIEYNAELYQSLHGVKADILEAGAALTVVRLIHEKNVNGQTYTQKELIGIGKEIMAPAEGLISVWRWRPLELGGKNSKKPPSSDGLSPEARPSEEFT